MMKKVYLALGILLIMALAFPASAAPWGDFDVVIVEGEDGKASGTFTISGETDYGSVDLVGEWSTDRASRPPTVNISVSGVIVTADGTVIEVDHGLSLNGNANVTVGINSIVGWVQSILES